MMMLAMRAFLSVAPVVFAVVTTSLCASKNEAAAKPADAAAPGVLPIPCQHSRQAKSRRWRWQGNSKGFYGRRYRRHYGQCGFVRQNNGGIQLWNVWLVMFVTLAMFPAIQSEVRSRDRFIIPREYFELNKSFFSFGFFAICGAMLTNWVRCFVACVIAQLNFITMTPLLIRP
ncbi:unnamed protein product [Toxocara canis]|uniref:Secreted protein n=1 Tax=Toxocara canis TaxID=6265 RepID=A0A183UZV5_TOXCA|nr:unnamed protein product [Toxocara canis]